MRLLVLANVVNTSTLENLGVPTAPLPAFLQYSAQDCIIWTYNKHHLCRFGHMTLQNQPVSGGVRYQNYWVEWKLQMCHRMILVHQRSIQTAIRWQSLLKGALKPTKTPLLLTHNLLLSSLSYRSNLCLSSGWGDLSLHIPRLWIVDNSNWASSITGDALLLFILQ